MTDSTNTRPDTQNAVEPTIHAPERNTTAEERARAQKREWARAHKGHQKTISITQTAEQTEADRQTLREHNTTVLAVWREAMQRLRATPTTPTD